MPDTISRSLHDLGLAAWSGGTLANAVALNSAAARADSPKATGAVANAGWDRWAPVNAAAIGAHLLGGLGVVIGNRGRLAAQHGVGSMSVAKTALTAAALAATGYARVLGRTVSAHEDVPAVSGTVPHGQTPDEVVQAQQRLRVLQWVVPALTGAIVVVNAYAGEQQRAGQQLRGLAQRITG